VNHVAVDERDQQGSGGNTSRRVLTEPLGLTDVAVNQYELAPGDRFSGGLHAHVDQEEVFYVTSGTATFDYRRTADAPTETVAVGPGEAVRCGACGESVLELDFGPGQNHSVCPACGDVVPVDV
jgi:uncharacterized cupin superfamily protein